MKRKVVPIRVDESPDIISNGTTIENNLSNLMRYITAGSK